MERCGRAMILGVFFSWRQGDYVNVGVDKVVLDAFRMSGRRMKGKDIGYQ